MCSSDLVASNPLEEVGRVTISIGVAACPASARTERELYAASDAALYLAKNEGRNLSVLADAKEFANEPR